MRSYKNYSQEAIEYDPWLVMPVILLIGIGFVTMSSASLPIALDYGLTKTHFIIRQLMHLIVGAGLFALALKTPIKYWYKVARWLLLFSIIGLILVLSPLGSKINGSSRWIKFGPMSIQISEFVKFGIVTFFASCLAQRHKTLKSDYSVLFFPLILLSVVCLLLLSEPDFGATVVIIGTTLSMLFISGVSIYWFLGLMLFVGLGLGALAIFSPYRLQRLTAFLDPWSDQFDTGYQLTQSLLAFGNGGIWGVGLGNSVQKLLYLPESQTDFVVAILGEELGFIGLTILVILYIIVVFRCAYLGYKLDLINQSFAAYMAYGLGIMLGVQTLINLGVNLGILPTKGLTLPLVSYGGSSMLMSLFGVGVLHRISYEYHKFVR